VNRVRELSESDRGIWLSLWRGYLEFYKTTAPDVQYELTWKRLLDNEYNLYGLVAEVDGKVCGIVHYTFQNSTRSPINYCYLEDLFLHDFLLMDVHQWHCNTKINTRSDGYRLSFVMYIREDMSSCSEKKVLGNTMYFI
jgi:hypothetical protein